MKEMNVAKKVLKEKVLDAKWDAESEGDSDITTTLGTNITNSLTKDQILSITSNMPEVKECNLKSTDQLELIFNI